MSRAAAGLTQPHAAALAQACVLEAQLLLALHLCQLWQWAAAKSDQSTAL